MDSERQHASSLSGCHGMSIDKLVTVHWAGVACCLSLSFVCWAGEVAHWLSSSFVHVGLVSWLAARCSHLSMLGWSRWLAVCCCCLSIGLVRWPHCYSLSVQWWLGAVKGVGIVNVRVVMGSSCVNGAKHNHMVCALPQGI
jgi:hypothetical protein